MNSKKLAWHRENGRLLHPKFTRLATIGDKREEAEKKKLSIQYISSTIDDDKIYLTFLIETPTIKSSTATIFVEEMNAVNEIAVPKTIVTGLKSNSKQSVEVSFDKTKKFDRYIWQDGFVYQATITIDDFSAKTDEFKLKYLKTEITKQKTCYCNRDLEVAELKYIILELRKSEKTGQKQVLRDTKNKKNFEMGEPILDENGKKILVEITQFDELGETLFSLKMNEKIDPLEANFEILTKELNKAFKDYKINSCLRKIHFLAQAYQETQRFSKTYEGNPSSTVSGGEFYRGRGLLQLTHDFNYKEFYKIGAKKEASFDELKKFVPKIAKSIKLACQSSAWYWNKLKISEYADIDDEIKVSAAINYPEALDGLENNIASINHLSERKFYTYKLKEIFNYEKWHAIER